MGGMGAPAEQCPSCFVLSLPAWSERFSSTVDSHWHDVLPKPMRPRDHELNPLWVREHLPSLSCFCWVFCHGSKKEPVQTARAGVEAVLGCPALDEKNEPLTQQVFNVDKAPFHRKKMPSGTFMAGEKTAWLQRCETQADSLVRGFWDSGLLH